jgi:hypothetical protein
VHRMLIKHGVHFGFYIGSPPAFAVMEKYGSIPKAFLGLVGYLPLYIINLPTLLPLFLVGHVLYCCKVFPISRVSNLWLRLYTRSTKHTNNVVIIIPLLQESIFEEMLTESVPQMVIQIVNNSLTHVWTPLSYFSTAMSSIMICNGIWRLVYFRLYLKIAIDAIPTDLSDEIFNFSSIEVGTNGTHPIGGVSGVKSDPLIELKTVVSHSSETVPTEGISEELSPLIQRHISASIAELKAEMAHQKVEILSQLRSEAIALEERVTEKQLQILSSALIPPKRQIASVAVMTQSCHAVRFPVSVWHRLSRLHEFRLHVRCSHAKIHPPLPSFCRSAYCPSILFSYSS